MRPSQPERGLCGRRAFSIRRRYGPYAVIALHGQGTEGMSMEQHVRTNERPTAVTVAVAIWWVVSAIPVVALVPLVAEWSRQDSAAIVGGGLFVVFVLAFSSLCVWLTLRMARGSGTARLWLAIFAAFGAVNLVIGLLTGTLSWRLAEPAALVVAAVFTYLPSVRPFFPKAERRRRPPEPRTIGWDPTTGERITEPAAPRTIGWDPTTGERITEPPTTQRVD